MRFIFQKKKKRLKIARYAIEKGNFRAARHLSQRLGRKINYSTVRGMKVSYERLQHQ